MWVVRLKGKTGRVYEGEKPGRYDADLDHAFRRYNDLGTVPRGVEYIPLDVALAEERAASRTLMGYAVYRFAVDTDGVETPVQEWCQGTKGWTFRWCDRKVFALRTEAFDWAYDWDGRVVAIYRRVPKRKESR